MSDKIKITDTDGGSDGDKLKGCYFLPASDGTYDFYDKKIRGDRNDPLKTGITSGSSFHFHLPDHGDIPWQIDVKEINDEKASGDWSAGLGIKSPADDESSGTFQAQAGGATLSEESASSATA